MRTSVNFLAASAVVMAGAFAIAAVPGPEGAEHNGHHPVAPQPNSQAVPKQAADRTATMERHMKAMQEMRQKMAGAKTPAEHDALLSEHMKLMNEGLAMMVQSQGAPSGRPTGASPLQPQEPAQSMAQRHQMMDVMIEMMRMRMDGLPDAPAR